MQLAYPLLQSLPQILFGFYNQHMFGISSHFALPSIYRCDTRDYIYASGYLFFDQLRCNSIGLSRRAGDEDYDLVSQLAHAPLQFGAGFIQKYTQGTDDLRKRFQLQARHAISFV